MEEWKDIARFEGKFQISSEGRVKSLERKIVVNRYNGTYIRTVKEKIIIPCENGKGKLQVQLCENGIREFPLVHRLVAEAFVPNPHNYDVVHHIDHNPKNNRVENLEWMTKEEHDRLHRIEQAAKTSKKVYQYTLDGTLVKIWNSTKECGRNGFCQSAVAACCRGEYKQYKGFRWSYVPL